MQPIYVPEIYVTFLRSHRSLFFYQLMHNRVALKEYLNLHYNNSYMFRFNHHHQGAYYLSLLKL